MGREQLNSVGYHSKKDMKLDSGMLGVKEKKMDRCLVFFFFYTYMEFSRIKKKLQRIGLRRWPHKHENLGLGPSTQKAAGTGRCTCSPMCGTHRQLPRAHSSQLGPLVVLDSVTDLVSKDKMKN